MSTDDPAKRAWELMEKIVFCMFITRKDRAVRMRPMTATVRCDEHALYFFTDVSALKDMEIESDPEVVLAFADPGGQKYVSLTGTASLTNDRAKIKELWTPFNKAWWDSAEDPRIRLITVRPDEAEFWDSPGTVASYAKMIAAAVTGAKPTVGDNKKVAL